MGEPTRERVSEMHLMVFMYSAILLLSVVVLANISRSPIMLVWDLLAYVFSSLFQALEDIVGEVMKDNMESEI